MLFKRITALVLTICLMVGFVPAQAFGVEAANPNMDIDNNDVTLESTNSFGTLLTDAIDEEGTLTTVSEDYDTGYIVTDVAVSGSTATATYESLEDAILVVALYSEDGMQLLNTATTTVAASDTTATVEFTGDMPGFFLVSAYLLDVYDYSPLCTAYESPLYTEDMQALLAMTAEDCITEYGEDRVYNLDGSNETNFAVYAEGTILIRETAGVNTVASADDENLIYVFENTDTQITSLSEGNVVVYEYANEDLLIFKVSAIAVDSTTVTVTGADLEIEEVFTLMKLENTADGSDTTFSPSEMDESLTYDGIGGGTTYSSRIDAGEAPGASTAAWDGSDTTEVSFGFTLAEKKIGEADPDKLFTGEGTVSANLDVYLNVSLNFYISLKRQYLELKIKPGIKVGITFEGTVAINGLKLGQFDVMICYGVYAHLKPRLKVSFTGKATLNLDFSCVAGGSVEHRAGGHWTFKNLSSSPTQKFNLEFEGKLFFGVDLYPSLTVISKAVAEASIEALIGLEIKGTMHYGTGEEPDPDCIQYHSCQHCLDGDVSIVRQLSITIKFLKSKKLTRKTVLADDSWKLFDFYLSFDHGDFGIGECPYYKYKVTLRALNEDMSEAPNIEIKFSDGTVAGTTNKNGIVDGLFLDKGNYTFTATIEKQPVSTTAFVNTYTSVVLTSSKEYWERQEKLKLLQILPDGTSATSAYKRNQPCGDNAKWTLYTNGILEITGSGAMDDYSSASQQPWYKYQEKIKSIRVGDRITSIGSNAFSGCIYAKKVIIEDCVTELGEHAFYGCSGIKEFKMPVDLNLRYAPAFSTSPFTGCTNVEKLHYSLGQTGDMNQRRNLSNSSGSYYYTYGVEYISRNALKSVYADEGITHIGSYAFYNATALTQVALPFTVTGIGSNAFYGCTALAEMELPATLTQLGASAFHGCVSLQAITIPSGLTEIPSSCFQGCTSLTKLTIPDNITVVGEQAFYGCSGITELTMPVDLDIAYNPSYDQSPFTGCANIASIRYTYGQTGDMNRRSNPSNSSGSYYYTYGPEYISRSCLKSVTFDKGITAIGSYAFYDADALTQVEIPASIATIGTYAFYGCSALEKISLPSTLSTLGASAFHGCAALQAIAIPSRLTEIPSSCFQGCTSLTKLTIPDNITVVGEQAFYGCSGITELTMPVDLDIAYNPSYDRSPFTGCANIASIRYTYGKTGDMNQRSNPSNSSGSYFYTYGPEYMCRSSLISVTFDEGITAIGSYAFYDADALAQVGIPASVTTIGTYAFYGCSALEKISLPSTLSTLGASAFHGCAALQAIAIPSGLTEIPSSCFQGCTSLTKLTIPDNITVVGEQAFYGCSGITELTMPVDLDIAYNPSYDQSPFTGCANIASIRYTYGKTGDMNQRSNPSHRSGSYYYTYGPEYMCRSSLISVTFDKGITAVAPNAFYNATKLATITFYGDAPSFGSSCFQGVNATVLYPQGNNTWTEDIFQNYGGTITWTAYTLNDDGSISTGAEEEDPESAEPEATEVTETSEAPEAPAETEPAANGFVTVEIPGAAASGFYLGASSGSNVRAASTGGTPVSTAPVGGNKVDGNPDAGATPDAVYPGISDSDSTDDVIMQRTSFSGLVAGQQYVLLALASLEAEDLLASDNILFIDQAAANADGTLVFTYILKESVDNFHVFACGAAHRNLADAVITFPEVYTNHEARYISPVVVYDGETLIEGVDYVIVEGAVATEAGEYSCTLRGICNYTGLVTCSYTVGEYVSAQFVGSSVTLGDSLTMSFAINVEGFTNDDNYARVSRTNADGTTETATVPQNDWVSYTDNVMLIPFTDIAAKEMTDTFTVVICDASGQIISNQWQDSIRDYAMRMLEREDVIADTALRTVYVDMLNYGAAAQTFFGYAAEDPANKSLTDVQKAYATSVCETESSLLCSAGRAATSLTLKNRIRLDYFFKNSVIGSDYSSLYATVVYTDHYGNAITVRIDGTDFLPYGTDLCYVSIPGLAIADYAQAVTCTVYDADGNALAWVTDSIVGYAHRMAGQLPEIVDAIVKFGHSSYQYFH